VPPPPRTIPLGQWRRSMIFPSQFLPTAANVYFHSPSDFLLCGRPSQACWGELAFNKDVQGQVPSPPISECYPDSQRTTLGGLTLCHPICYDTSPNDALFSDELRKVSYFFSQILGRSSILAFSLKKILGKSHPFSCSRFLFGHFP